MKKRLLVISILTIIMLVFNFSSNVLAFGVKTFLDAQVYNIVPDNVKIQFDVGNVDKNIEEVQKLKLKLRVDKKGFLDSSIITLKSKNVIFLNVEDQNIYNISENQVYLKNIESNNEVNIAIPFKFVKYDENSFEEKMKISFNSSYVESVEKVHNFGRDFEFDFKWNTNKEIEINHMNLNKVKKDNKTLISYKISDDIENNEFLVVSKNIEVKLPEIDGKYPVKGSVHGNIDDFSYSNGLIKIYKNFNKVSDAKTEYSIDFEYDFNISEQKEIETVVKSKYNLVNGSEKNKEIKIIDNVSNIYEAPIIMDLKDKIGSGQFDIGVGTDYEINYILNIYNSDVKSEINFDEIEVNSTNKYIEVKKDEFIKLLGEKGKIEIINLSGTVVGTITKDNNSVKLFDRVNKFKISEPISEGFLDIRVGKVSDKNVQKISNKISLNNQEIEKNIEIEKATLKAKVNINQTNLTGYDSNEFVMDINLITKDQKDSLYRNPVIDIEFPNEVESFNIEKSAIIFDKDLTISNIINNGRHLTIEILGSQKGYNFNKLIDGAVLKLEGKLKINNFASKSNNKIVTNIYNDSSKEKITLENQIVVNSNSEFLTINKLRDLNGNIIESDNISGKYKINAKQNNEVIVNVYGSVVNKTEFVGQNTRVLGRIPTVGIYSTDGKNTELKTDLYSEFVRGIEVNSSKNVTIYYSEKENASSDLENLDNKWTRNISQNSKSYLIVLNDDFKSGEMIEFNYNLKLQGNVEYSAKSFANYSVYFNSNGINQNTSRIINSENIEIEGTGIASLETEVKLYNFTTGKELDKNKSIPTNGLTKVVIIAKNSGKEVAKNIVIDFESNNYEVYKFISDNQIVYEKLSGNEKIETNKDIEPGKTKEFSLLVDIPDMTLTYKTEFGYRLKLTGENVVEPKEINEKFDIKSGEIYTTITNFSEKEEVKLNDAVRVRVKVVNNSLEKYEGVKTYIKLPNNLIPNKNAIKKEYAYDEKTNTIVFDIGKIYPNDRTKLNEKYDITDVIETQKEFLLDLVYINETESDIELKAETIINDKKIDSNKLVLKTIVNRNNNVSFNSDVTDAEIFDNQNMIYVISVKNNKKETQNVKINVNIPKELHMLYLTVRDGEKTNVHSNLGTITEELLPGRTLEYVLELKPKILTNASDRVTVNINPNIYIDEKEQNVNPIKTTIKGSSNTLSSSNTDKVDEAKYSISGYVWIDENNNGTKENEKIINYGEAKLYDVLTGKLISKSGLNSDGKYVFNNLSKGKYQVKIDNIYNKVATKYQSNNSIKFLDSDFINNDNYFVTDEIEINNGNINNLNLGLYKDPEFKIDILQIVKSINFKNESKKENYEIDKRIVKMNLSEKEIQDATVLIEYNLKIKNNGNIPGYVKSITNNIPEGTEFLSELNPNWSKVNEKEITTTAFQNKFLNIGEEKDINLILVKKLSSEKENMIVSSANIQEYSNLKEMKLSHLDKLDTAIVSIKVTEIRENLIKTIMIISIMILSLGVIMFVLKPELKKLYRKEGE